MKKSACLADFCSLYVETQMEIFVRTFIDKVREYTYKLPKKHVFFYKFYITIVTALNSYLCTPNFL